MPPPQEGLKQIAAPYQIETGIKDLSADTHLAENTECTKPKLADFKNG